MSGVIGISTAENARFSTFYATLEGLQLPDEPVAKLYAQSAVISENRNTITQYALDHKVDWVLYLDDDHVLSRDALLRLLATQLDVVSAHYIQRQPPFNSVSMKGVLPDGRYMWKQLDPTERGLIRVDAVGAGCLLVRRRALEALEKPYWRLGQINSASWNDDLDFCGRLREAGFDIWLDLENSIGHMMTATAWPSYDPERGWVANFAKDPSKKLIAQIPMPLPGDI